MKQIIILMLDGTIYTKTLKEGDYTLLSAGINAFADKYDINHDNIIRVHYTNQVPKVIEL